MGSVLASLILGTVLLLAAGLKLADGPGARAALATYGITRPGAAHAAWAALVAAETVLGVLVAAGSDAGAYLAAALLGTFAAAQAVAFVRGQGGAPCACFGARGRIGPRSLARTSLLAAALAVLPLLPRRALTADEWLAVGLVTALLAIAGLGVVVLALARELGALRLRLAPEGALEVPHEGPEVGGRTALAAGFALRPGRIGLAVFTSEGCGMCRALAPAVAALGNDRLVELREFDEVRDREAWAVADVPGSPFAVALDHAGVVLAKGTFNSGAQLESIVATALRRRDGVHA
ncbi:MAG TPA: MauE/DoxX family redox-associated membrane protein [Solirubrobacteraceae bacterium]|jgi:hypothetical protein